MDKIKALKKLIQEQQRVQDKRDKITSKIGGYDHIDNEINKMIIQVTEDTITLEDVENFFNSEEIIQMKR